MAEPFLNDENIEILQTHFTECDKSWSIMYVYRELEEWEKQIEN